jgi:hypothetical protein
MIQYGLHSESDYIAHVQARDMLVPRCSGEGVYTRNYLITPASADKSEGAWGLWEFWAC